MLGNIFWREILDSLVSHKLLLIGVLCCTLIPLGIVVNQRAVANSIAQQERSLSEYKRSLEGTVPADQVEVKAFRPQPEMSGLAAGLDPAMPNAVGIRQGGMSYGTAQLLDNPIASLFGKIDLLFIVRFVLSLVAIILSYNMICGEKQTGTMKLILSNPVPRDSVILGKLMSAMVLLLLPMTVALLISILVLQLMGEGALTTSEQLSLFGGIFLVSVLYLGVFINMGAFVSSLTTRPLTSITVLLFLWASMVTVIPQCGGLLAEMIYPVESTESFLLKKSLIAQDIAKQRAAELSQYFGREDYEEIRIPIAAKYGGQLLNIHTKMDQQYQNSRQTQLSIASALSSVSPASPLTLALTELSGTGIEDMRRFNEKIAEFRGDVNQRFFERGYRDLIPGQGGQMRISTVDLKELPQFQYERRSVAEVWQSIAGSIALLIAFNIIFFISAYVKFRRYDVR
ncbi:MAG: ABC transporter permease subunit [Blastocatellia bacterium]|nr:ABC transporter permease subunit [Blastocatellia bacterium]